MNAKSDAGRRAIAAMRGVPVGGVFLVQSEGNPCPVLYMRVTEYRVRCFVNAMGEVAGTGETTMLISRPWFMASAYIVPLPVREQNRRIMLAHHGFGRQCVERWRP
jgi:hypothetical protein